jgi:hypothetical protein
LDVQHLSSLIIEFTDNTTVSVFGRVNFDPTNADGHDCPFANVPISLVDGSGDTQSTTSAVDGSFNFTLSRGDQATIFIDSFQGHTWSSSIYTSSLAMGEDNQTISSPQPVTRSLSQFQSISASTMRCLVFLMDTI